MQIVLDNSLSNYLIRAYQAGRIQINEKWVDHSVIISAKQLVDPWPPQKLSEVCAEHLLSIIALKPEIVLLGTGDQLIFPHPALLAPFYEKQIGIEVMDTAAACRTYNALVAEGRQAAAALLIH